MFKLGDKLYSEDDPAVGRNSNRYLYVTIVMKENYILRLMQRTGGKFDIKLESVMMPRHIVNSRFKKFDEEPEPPCY
jgi:hypothetical protein